MGNGHEGHVQAVGFAGLKVQELQDVISQAASMYPEVLSHVVIAVGMDPRTDLGRRPLEGVKVLADEIDKLLHVCENLKAALNEYGASF